MSGLPQELIDHIIDHIDHEHTLIACALVSSQWSTHSRKRLFARVELYSKECLERWCARIPLGPSGPSPLVKGLSLFDCWHSTSTLPIGEEWIQPSTISGAASHLRSLSGLRELSIMGWNTYVLQASFMLYCVGPLPGNVTRLTLEHIFVYPSTLAMFVSHFPRLDDLSICDVRSLGSCSPHHGFHDKIVPTHPRGELNVAGVIGFRTPKEFFEAIALLEPRFREVTLAHATWRDFWPVVEACAGSLEVLHIVATATRAGE